MLREAQKLAPSCCGAVKNVLESQCNALNDPCGFGLGDAGYLSIV